MTWHRKTFAVVLHPLLGRELRAELATGWVCGPFGIYQGNAYEVGRRLTGQHGYTLVHLPSQTPKLKLPRVRLCREAAAEFAEVDLDWSNAWAPDVTGPPAELDKAREINRRWTAWAG